VPAKAMNDAGPIVNELVGEEPAADWIVWVRAFLTTPGIIAQADERVMATGNVALQFERNGS